MRPVFADPKTDLVFKRIFGVKARKKLLIALLNDLLALSGVHRIVDLEYLPSEQVPPIDGRKLSIVDVKCTDKGGVRYIVEMQVLNVEGFEKRLVYNLCKSYAGQLGTGEDYPQLNDVVAGAICDFSLWPEFDAKGAFEIPMLSRWHMVEEQTGARRLRQMRYAVLELPKYGAGKHPQTLVDRWAYFFREAERLRTIPKELSEGPVSQAMDIARTSRFTPLEWEAYDQAKMAEQDARGALSLASKSAYQEGVQEGHKEGRKEGRKEGQAASILRLLEARGVRLSTKGRAQIEACEDGELLDRWLVRAASARSEAALFTE